MDKKCALLLAALLAGCGSKKAPAAEGHDAAAAALIAPAGIRLADGVAPLRYRVALEVDPTKPTFHGEVEIDVSIAAATPAIWLHARDLTITRAIARQGGVDHPLEVVAGEHDRIALRGDHAAGEATLIFSYDGVQDPDRAVGLRRREDRGDWYVVTQLESDGARRALPCFDEPGWKVPWQVTLTVPKGTIGVGNAPVEKEETTADGGARLQLAVTAPLPTYLIAFAVGPFETVDAGKSRHGVPMRIIVPRGRGGDAGFAAVEVGRILAWLEDYTGIPYPYAKLDHLVIPSQPRGAMENAGLITYPPRYLLVGPDESIASRALVVSLIAHETAHQWFGDLVTMAWWDDLWLNEAFAVWAATKTLAALYPELGGPSQMATERRVALDADGKASSRKIRQPVLTSADIDAAFDGITYQKGATVIRMFERWLGVDGFQRGVRRYLERFSWKNATAADFLAAIGEGAGRDVATPFATFLDQAGAPVVDLHVDCPEGAPPILTLHQRRHLLLGATPPSSAAPLWQLPICVRVSDVTEPICTLLTEVDGSVPLGARCPTWLVPNVSGLGYYRASLPPRLQAALATAPLGPGEQAAIDGDLSLAVDAGEAPLAALLDQLPRLGASTDRAVRELAVARLESLTPLVGDADRPAFARLVDATVGKVARRIGWVPAATDDVADANLRGRVLTLAAVFAPAGSDFARWAPAMARTWLDDHSVVPVSLWPSLLGAAVRAAPDDVFELLLARATTEPDAAARRAILGALAEVEDVPRLERVLALLLADDPTPFERVALLGGARTPATAAAVLDFVRHNQAALLTHLGDDWHRRLVITPCLADRRAEVVTWLTAELAPRPEIGELPVTQAIEAMDQCIAVRAAHAPALSAWLATR